MTSGVELQAGIAGADTAFGRPRTTHTTRGDVGRDPWFLMAIERRDTESPIDAPAASQRNTSCAPCESTLSRAEAAPRSPRSSVESPPAAMRPVAATISAAQHAPVVDDSKGTAGDAIATAASAPSTRTDAGIGRANPAPALPSSSPSIAGQRPPPRRVSLHVTADGLEVVARDYFLDDGERALAVQQLLTSLQSAGRQPRVIRFNGETAWTAADGDGAAAALKRSDTRSLHTDHEGNS